VGNRNLIFLAVAVVVGLIAVVLANSYFSGVETRQERVAAEQRLARIVVATQPLEFGQPLTAQNLRLQNFPQASVPQGAFRSVEEAMRGGRVALRPIVPGEPVLRDKVSGTDGRAVLAANLSEGMRAVSIPVSATTGVSGFVRPGDTVDVMLTRSLGESDYMTDVILEDVVDALHQVRERAVRAVWMSDDAFALLDKCVASLRDKDTRRRFAELYTALGTGDRSSVVTP